MFPGPVFTAELITTARRARYYVIRFVYGILLLYFVIMNLQDWRYRREGNSLWSGGELSIKELAMIGQGIFITFAVVQALTVLVLTPALTAGVIADEKRRKTLHDLLTTRLSSTEIVLGKLMARLLHIVVFLSIGLPVMSLLSLFGGVEPILVLGVYAATLSTAVILASLAILISTFARRPREATSQVYLLALAWLFVPGLIAFTMPMAGGHGSRFTSGSGPSMTFCDGAVHSHWSRRRCGAGRRLSRTCSGCSGFKRDIRSCS